MDKKRIYEIWIGTMGRLQNPTITHQPTTINDQPSLRQIHLQNFQIRLF